MANKDDYLTYYREFFENFAQTINPNDQLPVKLASYKLVNVEVVGGIIDWTTQYLTQKKCPPNLIAPLIKIVIEEIRKICKKQPVFCGFIPSDNAYEPLKLMQTVMAKTNEVCLRYLDNSQLCSLPSPGNPTFLTSVCAVKNTRRRMEDRHVVIHDLNTIFNIQEASPSSYYAVFDGHAGHDAAAYSSAHLHQFLAENKYFISNPEQALLDAFCKTDALFIDKCRVENLSSGTTAVVALLRPKEKVLYIAWVGDSQALLVNQGKILQVVNPHKPSRKDERERIEKQGGCVLLWGTWRVNGQLAVSRAIGDAEYKPHVIAIPDIREIPLDGGEDFLILACDGLWDFVTEDCAARAVYRLVTDNPDDIDRISQHLAQLSKEQGSSDNISVIVVFLREPSKIAAEAHWANRNCTPVTMDTSLDNANNPFAISNGSSTDNIIMQKTDGLLLNLTDNFKQNGPELSPTSDFYGKEKSNGKRTASDFEDDDFGPETDVDAVDDALSSAEKAKGFDDVFSNNNPADGVYNQYMEHQEKADLEIEQKQESGEFEKIRLAREETPTPPADAVHDVSGLVDNTGDSESEDEWNYYKGDEANKENISPQPDRQVAEVPEEDDNMSQLNPDAAEFVPVSPTRSIPSPACRTLLNDQVISQSPRRPTNDIDINVPNPVEFEKEVKSRPSEVDSYSNGHSDSDHNITATDLMENILNGKNIDEIPEFQPGSTPKKNAPSEEFHFGPNAAPFTPAKFLDQSEASLSTKAIYGDESTATLGTSFDESVTSQDATTDINLVNKESDPMSMSFYADKGDTNPFDLNELHILPENIDEFLKKPDNSTFNDTISDLPEHHPLGEHAKSMDLTVNNDDAIQTSDLTKSCSSYDIEKELASPLEPEKELSEAERYLLAGEEGGLSITPEPSHENLLGHEFCQNPGRSETPEVGPLPRDVELISSEPTSKQSESASARPTFYHEEISESSLPEATEVEDLLRTQSDSLPPDVELIPPQLTSTSPNLTHDDITRLSQLGVSESVDLSRKEVVNEEFIQSHLPLHEEVEINTILQAETYSSLKPETYVFEATSFPDKIENIGLKSTQAELPDLTDETQTAFSPTPEICESPQSKISTSDICCIAKSPVRESKSPECQLTDLGTSPICELPVVRSPPICGFGGAESPIRDIIVETIDPDQSKAKSPILEEIKYVCDIKHSDTPIEEGTCGFTKSNDIEQAQLYFERISKIEKDITQEEDLIRKGMIERAQEHFEEMCKPKENVDLLESSQGGVVTSLSNDELSSPAGSPLPVRNAADQSTLISSITQNIAGVVQESIVNATDELKSIMSCSIPPCKSVANTELVVTADVNSFLDHSLPPNVTPPLSSTGQEFDDLEKCVQLGEHPNKQAVQHLVDTQQALLKCVYPLPTQTGEQIEIKTDNIEPQYAEHALVTPSEESKEENVPTAPLIQDSVNASPVKRDKEEKEIGSAVGIVTIVAAGAASVAVASTETEKGEKKKPGALPAKKPAPKSTTSKTGTRGPAAPKVAVRLSASPKAAPAKIGSAKHMTTSAPKQATAKSSARPRPSTVPKSTEKKPLTNGEIVSSIKSPLTSRKTTETTLPKSSTPRPATSVTTKLGATKTAAPRQAPPRPVTTSRVTATRTTTTATSLAPPKPRPTTLANKITTATVTKTSTTAIKSPTKTSPKVGPAPSTKHLTTAVSRPRVPLTKTVTKAPDTEKQNKESANKLTASRHLTSTIRSSSATARSTSTVIRKTENKTSMGTRTMKTTTTTTKSTTSRKPAEIVRNINGSRTKTTKIEKPKENGVSPVVTEEITTVVNNTSSVINSEPQLIKDNSPIDNNKLLIENTLIQPNTAD